MKLDNYTLPRLIPPLCLGIIMSRDITMNDRNIILMLSLSFLFVIVTLIITLIINYNNEYIAGIAININLILLAFCLEITDNRIFCNYQHTEAIEITSSNHVILESVSLTTEKANSYRIRCKIINTLKEYPDVYIYINKKNLSYIPTAGHIFYIKQNINKIKPSKPEDNFDFQQYNFYNGIGYNNFINSSDITIIDTIPRKSLKYTIISWQSQLLKILNKYSPDNKSYTVASALILGYNEISGETRQSFTTAGTIHVLCVSGLHVATVYLLITTLLNIIPAKRAKRYFSPIISIILLWTYAAITGLSSSVTRASLMLSMMSISKIFNMKSDIINTIAGSAIILIFFNPDTIFLIGCQMSYAAVTGIILFQKYFSTFYEQYFEDKKGIISKIIKNIIDTISVSIAVQIIIAPIIMYYFHNFSTYFIFANIIAIPLATLILYFGLTLLLISFVPVINTIIGRIFYLLIDILIKSAEIIEKIPHSLSTNISFDGIMLLNTLVIVVIIKIMINRGISARAIKILTIMVIILLSYKFVKYKI